jgi:8-oxo-dGTP pyrophosphatase MutT (NUDIX family)
MKLDAEGKQPAPFILDIRTPTELPISCGTLVINSKGQILLCHVTDHELWDLPKGMQEENEPAVQTAKRELFEETGLDLQEAYFEDLGCFKFRPEKDLHVFKVRAPNDLESLDHLVCTSHFIDKSTGQLKPEMDGFCWASREDIKTLCGPNMQRVLLSIDW